MPLAAGVGRMRRLMLCGMTLARDMHQFVFGLTLRNVLRGLTLMRSTARFANGTSAVARLL